MDLGLVGRILVVTGGASGLGAAVVDAALAEGMRVAVVDRDAHHRTDALCLRVDVSDPRAVALAIEEIESTLGPIDAAVLAAGIAPRAPFLTMDDRTWESVVGVNVTGVMATAREVGRRMVERRRGSLVAIGSSDSFGGHDERTAYVATKHAVLGLVRSLAIEWGPHQVRVNMVAPGPVDTPMMRRNNDAAAIVHGFFTRIPLQRLSAPVEQADACLFLLSDRASFITGTSLSVDGGLTAGHLTALDVAHLAEDDA